MIHELTRLGFLVSGRGSNLQAIIQACKDKKLYAEPAVVISNNASAGALDIARSESIPAIHISRNTHPDIDQLDRAITETLQQHQADLVILAGYMKKIGPVLLKAYRNRIINIHPSLLPKFGGQGMYGMRVHAAVLAAGERVTGATVHLVDYDYDSGPILGQRQVEVLAGDNPESLAIRVLAAEHALLVEVLQDIIKGKIILPDH
ncbi:MAG: phosphoribosylglycinamide formyltransferase [Gammaproteobacteria bacterium RIFCSPLOWO2_02_FULL_47_50]|nr:MAG: phosphoribosylglycinamide formyltransferase [Gammaproteobacteria bacterium RIFCSPLOWO2_02_47_7]OGT64116.1 MAG: phosphoribosylglycinamide formyltransferase [Gammaproteobacteria bacterium RIFCSPLOWO2_01_FULL_47_190]OGT75291.1 MAG: phosphoribosylglycinamide formyltransferase [Gammaproteobacteria bacterium RIFCSPLOWO2_12_47_11]OGT81633.1 MAG: phosphoribosylglycinamide formyltransferase [Gammaproteobacteria bacterium RIFCSPLOWO2_02_FULL_47_50]OGT87489.1 MAG: phosphoribosylglycinamide formylt